MLGDKLSPGTKPGFLKSEKMFRFKILYIHNSVSENVYVTKYHLPHIWDEVLLNIPQLKLK